MGLRDAVNSSAAPAPVSTGAPAPISNNLASAAKNSRETRAEFRREKVAALAGEKVDLNGQVARGPEAETTGARQPERSPKSEVTSDEDVSEELSGDDSEGAVNTTEVSDSDASEGDADNAPPEVTEMRERLETLEKDYSELQISYRNKTHRLAETLRAVTEEMEAVETAGAFYAQLAENGVKAYENIDWASLRSNPEQYQQAQAGFKQAAQQRDQLVTAVKQLMNANKERRDSIANRQAAMSRDVLAVEIKDWGKDTYKAIQDYAINQSGLYSEKEFAEITDWRVLKLIDQSRRLNSAPADVGKLTVKGGKKPPVNSQANRLKVDVTRDASGRFVKAQQELRQNNSKQTRRNFFMSKLAAERSGR